MFGMAADRTDLTSTAFVPTLGIQGKAEEVQASGSAGSQDREKAI
jgi:hypothetical protein